MPKLGASDPKTLQTLLETYGTRDTGIDRDSADPRKGDRAHRNAALLLWFWAKEQMPGVEPVAGHLVDVIQRRNDYGYRGWVVTVSEAQDFTEAVKEVRVALGDEPMRVYEDLMRRLREAQGQRQAVSPPLTSWD